MSKTSSFCRLSVFLSLKSQIGVILRRGPSEWAQIVLWDRAGDIFTPGQWFHGRIYERRCDLSPNGELFVYFAARHGAGRHDCDDIGEAWTAISRPPFLTAIGLWPNVGSWYGGGLFKTDRLVLLDATCTLEPHPKFRPGRLKVETMGAVTSPWEQRLLRDGWALVERGFDPRTGKPIGKNEIWQKHHPDTALKLCRQMEDIGFNRHGGPHAEVFWLETGDDLIPIENASWADWDSPDRLVFVRQGRLFAATLDGTDLHAEELFDFNPMTPCQVETPDWAKAKVG